MAQAINMILCDTNILIEFYKNNPKIVQTLQEIEPEHLAISVITQAELYYGALDKSELRQIKQHLSLLHSYPVNEKFQKLSCNSWNPFH